MDDVVGQAKDFTVEVGADEVIVQDDVGRADQYVAFGELYLSVVEIKLDFVQIVIKFILA